MEEPMANLLQDAQHLLTKPAQRFGPGIANVEFASLLFCRPHAEARDTAEGRVASCNFTPT
ncbi:hypothetical protein PCANC_00761 [Puccinia coronata f. sp. avenae]|uniref:Uncharacterized protein n=1 Tax=Puccinia coronata f. sp. avenae TaxID=200324 RepID=A0A2N5W751_9BASI|nr:hypothetical protein PCANC_00761 [Puccinia coronata f. sp. avenae]